MQLYRFLLIFAMIFSLQANDFFTDLNIKENTSFEEAKKLFDLGEYEKSGDMFLDLWLTGDKRTYSYLAEILSKDNKDCKKAASFAFHGIKEEDCRSYLVLSDFYKKGVCTKQNNEKYKKYFSLYDKCVKKTSQRLEN